MVGPSPSEDAQRDLDRDRNDARLIWAQNVRTVLRVFETTRLPYPRITRDAIAFSVVSMHGADARRAFKYAGSVLGTRLGVTFTEGPGENRYSFTAATSLPGGTALIVEAATEDVAAQDAAGQWVRLPVEDESEAGQ